MNMVQFSDPDAKRQLSKDKVWVILMQLIVFTVKVYGADKLTQILDIVKEVYETEYLNMAPRVVINPLQRKKVQIIKDYWCYRDT